jgi:hypothetical protein
MSSLKQVEANRRNALKSTGPTTQAGKDRSRRNAIRHGLTAETVIAVLEDTEDYQSFEAAVTADYEAETAVERELVLRLASILWRLRRATSIETALFESEAKEDPERDNGQLHLSLVGPVDRPEKNLWSHSAVRRFDAAPMNEKSPDAKDDLGRCYMRLAALPTFALDRLNRYEHLLWRQARQLVFALESLRRRKQTPRRSSFPFSFRQRAPSAS